MVGVTLGEEPTSLVGRLQHSAPAVKQINSEFQDAVSNCHTNCNDTNSVSQISQSKPSKINKYVHIQKFLIRNDIQELHPIFTWLQRG